MLESARQNFWKNEAITNPNKYSARNLQRMVKGKTPKMKAEIYNRSKNKFEIKDVSMELHHKYLSQRAKSLKANEFWNLQPATPWGHEAMDTFRHTGTDLKKIIKGVNSW